MTITFREIGDGDVEAVVALWQACGLVRAWNDPYKDISFARESASSTILVGMDQTRIVASAMVGHDGHRGMLYYVAVDPSLQGKGIGKAMVRAAEAWLGERGVWKVNLLVRSENDRVRGFYEALGYEVNPVFCMARRITA
ncbi:MAG: GNAT family acetyltransferase [Alphaproteobacteria bacterium]|nr:GNAT family acetyltransferase [Alphaproteobacteria bacterium]